MGKGGTCAPPFRRRRADAGRPRSRLASGGSLAAERGGAVVQRRFPDSASDTSRAGAGAVAGRCGKGVLAGAVAPWGGYFRRRAASAASWIVRKFPGGIVQGCPAAPGPGLLRFRQSLRTSRKNCSQLVFRASYPAAGYGPLGAFAGCMACGCPGARPQRPSGPLMTRGGKPPGFVAPRHLDYADGFVGCYNSLLCIIKIFYEGKNAFFRKNPVDSGG